jgi:hypothetical protein
LLSGCDDISVRTTLTLPEDVYEAARSLAEARRISIGEAVAELIRRGLRPPVGIVEDAGFPCFDVPSEGPQITLEHTLALEDEL